MISMIFDIDFYRLTTSGVKLAVYGLKSGNKISEFIP